MLYRLALIASIFGALVGTVSLADGSSDDSSDDSSDGSEYRRLRRKRIRREIRDLDLSEWERITNAMNVMKFTTTEEGQEIYGDDYRSYDWFVCLHARSVETRLGDQAHGGPFFLTWHSSYVLLFENVLRLIDPAIESLPYMDWRPDIENGIDTADSVFFTDTYFGSLISSLEENYAVIDGPFAHWPIENKYTSDETCVSQEWDVSLHNVFGFLRKRTNPSNSPYLVRMGDRVCNRRRACGDPVRADDCQVSETNISDFHDCMNGVVHASHHQCIGGSAPMFEGQGRSPIGVCRGLINGGLEDPDTSFRLSAHSAEFGCWECPDVCGLDDDPIECLCIPTGDSCEIRDLGTWDLSSQDPSLYWFNGDMSEPVTSPNDPVFMFVHSNVDRYLTEWKVMNREIGPFYGWPEDHPFIGLSSYQYPRGQWEGLYGGGTFGDILEAQDFLNTPYTYDTVIEMVNPN